MALEGTIKEFGLADIFQLIGLQKKTGILFLKGEAETVNIHFEDGMVVKADESRRHPKYQFGRILVNRGKVTSAQVSECLEIQKSTGQRLGGVMISQGLINKDELRDALTFQISEAVYKVFRWKSGDYKFDQERVDYDRDTIVPISTEHVLMDGIRMLDEWPQIEKKLPDLTIVLDKSEQYLRLVAKSEEDEDIFAGFDGKEKDIGGLSNDSKHIISLIDGKRSVLEVVELSKLGEFDTYKSIADLLDKHMAVTTQTRPEVVPELSFKPEVAAARSRAGYLDKLVYAFVIIALLSVYVQLTGTRKIMNPNISKLEDLKRPFGTAGVKRAGEAVSAYYFDFGAYPDSAASLSQLDYISEDGMSDPWGGKLVIDKDADGNVVVISAGPDRVLNTGDDIFSIAHP